MSSVDSKQFVLDVVRLATSFQSSIVIQKSDNFIVDAKSLMSVFISIIGEGDTTLHIHGPDADKAAKDFLSLFELYQLDAKFVVMQL